MIKVVRPDKAPASLSKPYKKDGRTELQRVIDHIVKTGSPKGFEYSRYKSADVKLALEEMFNGKCAYCETPYGTNQPVDVEHFRPKGAVEGVEHEGYWWLAMDWHNLLPSCIDCNRRRGQQVFVPEDTPDGAVAFENAGKKDLFPLTPGNVHARINPTGLTAEQLLKECEDKAALDAEEDVRLLLDPTKDKPHEHLTFKVTSYATLIENSDLADQNSETLISGYRSWVSPVVNGVKSDKGEASMKVYGLNRLGLLQARSRALLRMELLLALYVDVCKLDDMLKPIPEGLPEEMAQQFTQIIGRLRGRIESEITAMKSDQATYAAAIRAWMKQYCKQFL